MFLATLWSTTHRRPYHPSFRRTPAALLGDRFAADMPATAITSVFCWGLPPRNVRVHLFHILSNVCIHSFPWKMNECKHYAAWYIMFVAYMSSRPGPTFVHPSRITNRTNRPLFAVAHNRAMAITRQARFLWPQPWEGRHAGFQIRSTCETPLNRHGQKA